MGAAREITDAAFESEVLSDPGVTITDFWADWCQPCKRLTPILEEIATESGGSIKLTKIDVDRYTSVAERYGVTGLPTLLVFKRGALVETIVGFQPKDKLLHRLAPHIG